MRVWGLEVEGLGFRDQGLGFRASFLVSCCPFVLEWIIQPRGLYSEICSKCSTELQGYMEVYRDIKEYIIREVRDV